MPRRVSAHWTRAQMNRVPRAVLAAIDEVDLDMLGPDDLIVTASSQTSRALRYLCPFCTTRYRGDGLHDQRRRAHTHEHVRNPDGTATRAPSQCEYVRGSVFVVPTA